jgi:hypothetical protein
VTPEQPTTREECGESQQQDEADRDADRQRRDIAGHRQPDDGHHQADHDAFARRQPGRPTRSQAQTEDQAAHNQR